MRDWCLVEQDAESQNEWSWKGPLKVTLVQLPAQSTISLSRLPKTVSSQVFNFSNDEDYTTSLEKLFQYFTTFIIKKCSFVLFMFNCNFPCFNIYPLPLFCLQNNTENSLLPNLLPYPLNQAFKNTEIPLSLFFSRVKSPSSFNLLS